MPRSFVDTNVFVYAYDADEPLKQAAALRLLRQLLENGTGAVSSQVIQEFSNVALKKFKSNLSVVELDDVIRVEMKPMWGQTTSPDFYRRTLQLYDQFSLSYYDALIVQAALDLGCQILYSEDMQDGQDFGGVVVKNPF